MDAAEIIRQHRLKLMNDRMQQLDSDGPKAWFGEDPAAPASAAPAPAPAEPKAKAVKEPKAKAVKAVKKPKPSKKEDPDAIHVKRKKIPKHIKTLIWNKYMGVEIAQADCVSCRSVKITNRSFHCGHVIAESKGGDLNINNLRPICEACNGSMGTRSMNEFTQEFFGWSV
jgi:hypothetical protein